ncbi:MAG TPA: DUF1656 domain-containing protein [Methylophilus sp.]
MPREIAFWDALVPSLFLALITAALLTWLIDYALAALKAYRLIWYPALFRVAIFCLLFAVLGLAIY